MRTMSVMITVGTLLTAAVLARADDVRLSDYYGFLPPEIYKIENRINNLIVRDIDGDGLADVLVVDNSRSRVVLLLTSAKARANQTDQGATEANTVGSDTRMKLVSVPVNKEIVSLQVGDFNKDGKPDLAFYGTPDELVVLYNRGPGEFGNAERVNVGEAVEGQNSLAIGDLDGDGLPDLALLAADEIVVVPQRKEGGLGTPERFPHTGTHPSMLLITDLDGDGRQDLVLLDGTGSDPLHVRFGSPGGRLGPEERLALETPRAIAFANLDGKPGSELLAIESKSGRVRAFGLAAAGGEGATSKRIGRLLMYPLPKEGAKERSLAVGDINGDKKADVIVSAPTRAQVVLYLQGPGGLGEPKMFPSLAGVKAVRVADLDGDGKGEVLVLSESEKQIGVSRLDGERLTFPSALPTSGEPVALDTGDLDGDGKNEVLYAVAAGRGGGGLTFAIKALKQQPSGEFVPFRWGQADAIEAQGLNSAPPAIKVIDINGDGHLDLLIFNEYGSPVLFLGRAEGPPTLFAGSPGPLANAVPGAVSAAKGLGPGLLVAQGSYARQVMLDAAGRWAIKDQFNVSRNDAQIVGAAAIDFDGDKETEVALVDRANKSVHWLDRKGSWSSVGEPLPLGPLNFREAYVADFDGDGRDDLLLDAGDRFGVVLTARPGPRLQQIASYEPTREKAHLGDLLAGDINGDARPDVIMTDTGEHFIEIAAFRDKPLPALVHALSFGVYERKGFRDQGQNIEPRELAIGDVDGDRREDLIVVVHDRVLVYRQDPGPKPKEAAGAKP